MALGTFLAKSTPFWSPFQVRYRGGVFATNDHVYLNGLQPYSSGDVGNRAVKYNHSLSSYSFLEFKDGSERLEFLRSLTKDDEYFYQDGDPHAGFPRGIYKTKDEGTINEKTYKIISLGPNPDEVADPGGLYLTGSYLFVADVGSDKILVTDLEGNYKTHFGTLGPGAAEFNNPYSVTTINDFIYVADFNNKRISIWKIISYNPFTVLCTNEVIDVSSYGDGKPGSIASYINYIYVCFSHHVEIFRIEDDGITATHEAEIDIQTDLGSGKYCLRSNGIFVTGDTIFVGVWYDTTETSDFRILAAYDNAINPYFNQHLTQTEIVPSIGATGGVLNISPSLASGSIGAVLDLSLSLTEGECLNQKNVFDQVLPITLEEAKIEKSDMVAEIPYQLTAGATGGINEILFALFVGINNAYGEFSFSLEGTIQEMQFLTFDVTLDSDDFTLSAYPPILGVGNIELSEFLTINSSEEWKISASMDLEAFGLTISSSTGAKASLEIPGLDLDIDTHTISGLEGSVDIGRILTVVSEAKADGIVSGQLSLPLPTVEASLQGGWKLDGSLLVGIDIEAIGANHATIGQLELTPFTVSGSIKIPIVSVGELSLELLTVSFVAINAGDTPSLSSMKAVSYNLERNAVTEYEDFPYTEIASDGSVFFVTDGEKIYLLNENVSNSIEGRFKLGNLDIDIPHTRNYIDLILSGDINKGTVIVTTENNTYSYPLRTVRTKGEKKASFGRGLRGRLKEIEFRSNEYFELDRIRLVAQDGKRKR